MEHHSPLKKNAALNAVRQACVIAFPFLTFAYATRVLGSEQMGMHAFGQSVVSYFVSLAMMGIPDYAGREASVLRDREEKLGKFVSEIVSINLMTAAAAYGLLFLLLQIWGKLRPYRYIILIQSTQMILTAAGTDWINTAFEDFLYPTVRYIVTGAGCIVAMLLLVKNESDLYAYTFLLMLASAGGNLWNIYHVRRYVKIKPALYLNVKQHLPPMLLFFISGMALIIYLNSDLTVLGLLVDDRTVGIYAVSARIYLMVKALINALVMAAVPGLSWLAAAGQTDRYRQKVSRLADSLLLLAVPAAAGMFSEAENIIYFAAGSAYLEGTGVLKIYSAVLLPAVCSCLFSYAVLMPFHMEKYFTAVVIPAAALNIGLNFFLIPKLGMYGAAVTTLLAEAMVFAVTLYFATGKINLRICRRDFLTELAGGAVICGICRAVQQLQLNPGIRLWLSIGMSAAGYCMALFLMKNSVFLELTGSIWKKGSSVRRRNWKE